MQYLNTWNMDSIREWSLLMATGDGGIKGEVNNWSIKISDGEIYSGAELTS